MSEKTLENEKTIVNGFYLENHQSQNVQSRMLIYWATMVGGTAKLTIKLIWKWWIRKDRENSFWIRKLTEKLENLDGTGYM